MGMKMEAGNISLLFSGSKVTCTWDISLLDCHAVVGIAVATMRNVD